ncbi:iron-sulfur cluster assembly protein [Acetobacteroides hydrogenigenes]|uniref:FeS assembly SUF system protein n=1 Tax=Acetobacteroides hydrogenigenes TaxID=979970 RepID=A0A4R2EAW5_9BACT|nr:iron-sulfur cluster assembly protein [Acetobacteroides hydrogenigenes]TCN63892.1 FeS assembly SUF system protein [Acetobacteroides hydrogenigenes]
MDAQRILEVEKGIVEQLKTVFDPEIPVNVYDLGLIYEIDVEPDGYTTIRMTLTAPNCPMAEAVIQDVNDKTRMASGVTDVTVILTFDPPWDKNMMSEEAMLELGLL